MAEAALPALRGNRFLVVGRAGMDLYADPPGTPIHRARRFTAALGGSSGNIAAALARQGGRVSLLTCVSDDAVGRFTLSELDRYGIDRSLVRTVGGAARNTLAVVDTNRDATEAVIYRNQAADLEMAVEDAGRPDYSSFDALIATGTALTAAGTRAAVLRAIERARSAGLTVALDLDYRAHTWPSLEDAAQVYAAAAASADIVVGNDVEFGVFAGEGGSGLEAARDLARDGRIVVYKRGGAGAITLSGTCELATGIFRAEALKPTGAGDGFLGGLLAALAAGHDLREAVLRGSATAAIIVSGVGCAPASPTSKELDAFIARHPGPTEPA